MAPGGPAWRISARAMRKGSPRAGGGFRPMARRAFALQPDQAVPDAAPRGNPGILKLGMFLTEQTFRYSISIGGVACSIQTKR